LWGLDLDFMWDLDLGFLWGLGFMSGVRLKEYNRSVVWLNVVKGD